jgi:hypothetical protein
MKKETTSLFSNLFGTKKAKAPAADPSREIIITSYSQPHVLQQRMQEEKLTHGETVTANLSPVRLEKHMGKMVMYFCPMKSIEVLQTITDGDGGSLPHQALVEDLTIPSDYKPGFYNLKNVILTSNGTMQVKATGKTVWEDAKSDF